MNTPMNNQSFAYNNADKCENFEEDFVLEWDYERNCQETRDGENIVEPRDA